MTLKRRLRWPTINVTKCNFFFLWSPLTDLEKIRRRQFLKMQGAQICDVGICDDLWRTDDHGISVYKIKRFGPRWILKRWQKAGHTEIPGHFIIINHVCSLYVAAYMLHLLAMLFFVFQSWTLFITYFFNGTIFILLEYCFAVYM